MSYRNPGIVKTPVAGEGLGEAIAGAVDQIGGAMITRKKEIEAENRRIEERRAAEDAAELGRYNSWLKQTNEDRNEFYEANNETKTNLADMWEESITVEERMLTESEADGLTLDERKSYSRDIYKEQEKRQNLMRFIGDVGAAKSAATEWEGDINFTGDKGEAFYQWAKELKSEGSKNPWKLTPGENNTSILSNGVASHTFDNKDIATFKFGVNTPEIFKNSDKMISDLNNDLKKRAFDADTATPQVLGEIRAAASEAGKTVQSELSALSKVDQTAFLAALRNKMGFSDEDVDIYKEKIYSGDAKKVEEAFTAINLKVQQRVDLATAGQTGLTLNDKNEFVKEEIKLSSNPASGGTAEWTLNKEIEDLNYKTKNVDKTNYLEVLDIKIGERDIEGSKYNKVTEINDNKVSIYLIDPTQATDKFPSGKAQPGEVFDLTNKSDVMSYLKNKLQYSTGTYKDMSELADAIINVHTK